MRNFLIAIGAALILSVLGGGGYVLLNRYFSQTEAPLTQSLEVGGVRLTFKSAYLRAAPGGGEGRGAAEIAAFFPDFSPAGRTDDVTTHTDLDARFDRIVFLKLRPIDPSLDPAESTARLYERFLDETSWSHPGGLTARAFVAGSPFEGDELYYVAPEGRRFAARCGRPDPARKGPNTCVQAFRYAGLDVEMRFSAMLLADWEALTDGARGLIEAARR